MMLEATAVIFLLLFFFGSCFGTTLQMEFAISPILEADYRLVVVHAPPPAAPCADYTSGELTHPTLVACLNHADQLTEQLQRPLPAPVRICDNTGKPMYRHDGSTGGGRTARPSRDLYPSTLGNFLTMLSGGLTAIDELGGGQREMHLVLSAGKTPTEAQPAALLATQFEAALAQLALPTTVAMTVWLVQPWQQLHTMPKTDAFCRQLQQQVLTQFSWAESERTPQKKKTYHGMLDNGKNNAELFYEGDMLRSLATAETCPLELLLLLQHLPSNKIRMRLAPSTKYVGQVLSGLPPACPAIVETELQLELAGGATAPALTASLPLPLNSCTVQLCSAPAARATGSAVSPLQNYRLTQLPTDNQPAHFALLIRNPYPQDLRVVSCNRDVVLTERDWEELDGTPLAKLQQASLGHLYLQHSLLLPTYTFEEAQPTLERLWLLPSDLPNVSGQRTAEVLQQHLLRLRDKLCQTFQKHVAQGPHAPQESAPPVPHMARQLSCLRAWGTQ